MLFDLLTLVNIWSLFRWLLLVAPPFEKAAAAKHSIYIIFGVRLKAGADDPYPVGNTNANAPHPPTPLTCRAADDAYPARGFLKVHP